MPKTRFLGVGLRKYISLYYYNDYRIHYVYFFYFFRDRPRFTRGFRKHLSKSIPHQALPHARSKNQTCFKGFSQECTSLYTLEGEFLREQKHRCCVEPRPSVPLLKRSCGEGKVGKKNRKVCITYNNILLWGVIVKRVYRICALFTRHFSFWGYRGLFLFIGKKEKVP